MKTMSLRLFFSVIISYKFRCARFVLFSFSDYATINKRQLSCDFYHLFFGYLKYQYGSPKLENKSNFFDLKYEVMTCINDIKTKKLYCSRI